MGKKTKSGQIDAIAAAAFDQRHFSLLLDMVRHGLRLERHADSGTRYRQFVVNLRNMLAGDIDLHVPVEALQPIDAERLKRAQALTVLLTEHAHGIEDKASLLSRSLDGPTQELMRRRRGSAIARLAARGKITEFEVRAASEIRRIAGDVFESACVAVMDYAMPRVDVSRRPRSAPPGALNVAASMYTVWCSGVKDQGLPLSAILDVIVQDMPFREAEEKWSLRNGALADVVVESLELYVELANWDTNSDAATGT